MELNSLRLLRCGGVVHNFQQLNGVILVQILLTHDVILHNLEVVQHEVLTVGHQTILKGRVLLGHVYSVPADHS
jgi:hypothetical protein